MGSLGGWIEHAKTSSKTLLSAMLSDSYGRFSESIYETARLVTLVPWLSGHAQRVRFLLERQRPDGSWGGRDGYGLLPALSATEALLTSLRRAEEVQPPGFGTAELARATDRGLRFLFNCLDPAQQKLIPDTVAVEILIPALVMDINAHLDRIALEEVAGLDSWHGSARLVLPDGMDDELLKRLRDGVGNNHALPEKLWHSLEAIGEPVQGASFVRPVQGAVSCSPAATAVWLGEQRPSPGHPQSVRYLSAVHDHNRGSVPVAAPLPVFERAWVLAAFASAGMDFDVPPALADSVRNEFDDSGLAAGPGLPPDADDSATALFALARLGIPRTPDCLWHYQEDEHFSCFPAERTSSTSTNAHILQAFGACLNRGWRGPRYEDAIRGVSRWLLDQQESDGSWRDKWHASPFYATAHCAAALAHYGGAGATSSVRKAVEWVLGNQRSDGSWGRWEGTYEETAYAVQVLLLMPDSGATDSIERATARGCAFLLRCGDDHVHPPLWHDKDLYTPIRIVQAEGLASLHRAHANPRVRAQVAQLRESSSSTADGAR